MSDTSEEILELIDLWDEEEERQVAAPRIFPRTNYMLELNDYDFLYRFRLTKEIVNNLVMEIYPYLNVTYNRNYGVSPLLQLLLALRFYALGTMLVSVADFIGVSISTASRIVSSVSRAIGILHPRYITITGNTQAEFYYIGHFPRVHGAVDGTHIPIQSPCSTIGEEFRNRKGVFSVNVQVCCDAKLMFQEVVARWPGSAHDATIFNNSNLRAQCETGILEGRWLLGDSAYACTYYLLTPLLNPLTRAEQLYNEAHIKTRNTIERCIGVWKRRFPVLALKMRLNLENIQAVIIATAVLHNMARLMKLQELEPEVDLDLDLSSDEERHLTVEPPQNLEEEVRTREELINTFFGVGL